ncbi:type II secretion system protein GspM [Kordiimonas sp. SCSIO 12610]|uniref:type II secretion system protein GspM n=1 Tax=Kordiimonas sp. SCSIO 12610 TaxID=2829597 RepID=UPI00210DF86C|nr:type II secretion system protein GspM [Kordiimonas sp. SCSIO 12610]UTW56521.1 type II secretion system protein M [Kordiimonas sp. SCSIO 12610]
MTSLMKWWYDRDDRERILLTIMAVMIVLFLVYFLLYLPLKQHRNQLQYQYEAAISDAAIIESAILEASRIQENDTQKLATTDADVRQVISQSAQKLGLTLTRLQPDQTSGLNVWVDSVETTVFYQWVLELQKQHGIYVARASLNNDNNGLIRVQLLLKSGAAA